eukprot:TRINITY_DN38159_c0_g1_i1.p1 TRINITY_DN38159_c0_g1~~TRINITY_DN38159_c0_g1_i1.p1  ORF type:complete len:163 (+),score=20.78 TRINITY_DN38159_c0_g1_i1:104-592(+)
MKFSRGRGVSACQILRPSIRSRSMADAAFVAADQQDNGGANQAPDDIFLLNNVLDLVRGVLHDADLAFSQRWSELFVREAPTAYVVGLGQETWMWIKFETVINGRRLPRESALVYGGFRLGRYVDHAEDCFLLAGLLDILYDLLLRGYRHEASPWISEMLTL